MEGEGVASERVARRWFQSFNTGEENTKDLPRSGKTKLCNIENIRRVFFNKIRKKYSMLSEELGASKDTIHRQIKTLGKSYRSCRSVPHELTPQKVQRIMNICRQLIGNPMDERFIRRIAIYDEELVYYRNPNASKQ